jgi:hypothetical protein
MTEEFFDWAGARPLDRLVHVHLPRHDSSAGAVVGSRFDATVTGVRVVARKASTWVQLQGTSSQWGNVLTGQVAESASERDAAAAEAAAAFDVLVDDISQGARPPPSNDKPFTCGWCGWCGVLQKSARR